MKKLATLIVIIFFSSAMVLAENSNEEKENAKKSESAVMTTTISGKVFDKITGESLAGVKVSVDGTENTVYSDFDGYFEISNIKPGNHKITASYISYKEREESINVYIERANDVELAIENVSE
ncbi:MAG: carboxypeptidase-like regulatory domain-containing protein [Bacteroidota bacterium]|nr:carboxypeptidase-like regulatory domain-containing protein [Bacteroidota bacterium]